jgi:allantoate deiminase
MGCEYLLGQKTLHRIHELASLTDEPGSICRTFLSPAMKQANALVGSWMTEHGCQVSEDGWGNLIGHLPGVFPEIATLLLGSHLDTVPNAGKFDGPLGVLVALASLHALAAKGVRLPFNVDIIGFSDEEGTRFHTAYLGSKALTGLLDEADLNLRDSQDQTVREAVAKYQGVEKIDLPAPRYRADQLLGYVEIHLEQGPVLQGLGQALGVVDAIAAQTRLVYRVTGRAGHAGTTPMNLRHDALAGAAELVLAVEQIGRRTKGLVATVGQLHVQPNASNVIPDRVHLSVDIRHSEKRIVEKACAQLHAESQELASQRGLKIAHTTVQSTDGVACSPRLIEQLVRSVKAQQNSVTQLTSGAGHDGVILSRLTPVAMLFVRCKDGLSHHPDEHVDVADIDAAITALTHFLQNFT